MYKVQKWILDFQRQHLLSDEKGTSFFNSIPLTRYKLKNKSDAWCNNFVQSERQYLNKINMQQEALLGNMSL